ncbi:leucine-rich repeat domain-containing protein [Adlercreutzia sp. ZJ138]|uniref:leucine-rich repeat domain-containing protein n=1 Tax=Adlercreutzia sp. ZJ138 TaxID=2709405 RepID=UPI0013EE23AB|nr:leucine-rich repeat domain-containing protein [Adlercreutzia sp. ZJ138]
MGETAKGENENLEGSNIPDPCFDLTLERYRGEGRAVVEVPEGVTRLADGAFEDCTDVECVVLPSTLERVGNRAFKGCTSLTSIKLPESVHVVGKDAFLGCSSLTRATLPSSLTAIPATMFSRCLKLEHVDGAENATSIGLGAFRSCAKIRSIDMFACVTTIGKDAFCGCTGLAELTLPETLTNIGDEVFRGCNGLRAVTLPDGLKHLGKNLFRDCYELTTIAGADQYLDKYADAFPREFVEATGRIRPQDKWLKTKEFRQAHEEYVEQLREDVRYYREELANLGQLQRDATTKEGKRQSEEQATQIRELLNEANGLLKEVEHPSMDVLVEFFLAEKEAQS